MYVRPKPLHNSLLVFLRAIQIRTKSPKTLSLKPKPWTPYFHTFYSSASLNPKPYTLHLVPAHSGWTLWCHRQPHSQLSPWNRKGFRVSGLGLCIRLWAQRLKAVTQGIDKQNRVWGTTAICQHYDRVYAGIVLRILPGLKPYYGVFLGP